MFVHFEDKVDIRCLLIIKMIVIGFRVTMCVALWAMHCHNNLRFVSLLAFLDSHVCGEGWGVKKKSLTAYLSVMILIHIYEEFHPVIPIGPALRNDLHIGRKYVSLYFNILSSFYCNSFAKCQRLKKRTQSHYKTLFNIQLKTYYNTRNWLYNYNQREILS